MENKINRIESLLLNPNKLFIYISEIQYIIDKKKEKLFIPTIQTNWRAVTGQTLQT